MSYPLSVLILEDRPEDAELMIVELQDGDFDPEWNRVETEDEFLDALERPIDVILADYTLPRFDAVRALSLVQERNLDIPVIVVTGAIDDNTAAQTIKAGATDYVLKDRLARLPAAIESALAEKESIAKRETVEHALADSNSDLTSQLTRRTAMTALSEAALAGGSIDDLLTLTLRTCSELLPADFVKVLELLPGDRELLLRAGEGWNEGTVGLATVPNDPGSQAGFTLLHDEPVLVHNLEQETRFGASQLLTDHAVRSGISIVIRESSRPFGVLAVHSQSPGAFKESEVQFMRSLANVLGSAFRLRKIENELGALAEMSRVATASTDMSDVYERLAESVGRLIPFDRMVVSVVEGEEAYDAYVTGTDIPEYQSGKRYPIDESGAVLFENSRVPLVIERSGHENLDRESSQRARDAGLHSSLVAPLVWNAKVIGSLQVRSKQTGIYGSSDIEVISKIADQIAGAVANTQAYGDLERESQVREALAGIGRLVSSSLDFQAIAEELPKFLRSIFKFDGLVINQVDIEAGIITNVYAQGTGVPPDLNRNTGPLSGTLTEQVIKTGQDFLLKVESPDDVINRYPVTAIAIKHGTRSFLTTPLIVDDRTVGAFQLRSPDVNSFSDDDIEIAQRIARPIAGALANSQLYAEVRREAQQRKALAEISRVVTSSTDIREVYEQFAVLASELVPFDRLVIAIYDVEAETLTDQYVAGTEIAGSSEGNTHLLSRTVLDSVVRKQIPFIATGLDDSEIPEHPARQASTQAGLRSMLAVPLISRGRVIGTLNLKSGTPGAYSDADAALVQHVADQIAGTVANSWAYQNLERESQVREALAGIGRLVSSSLDFQAIAAELSGFLGSIFRYDGLVINQVDVEVGTITDIYGEGTVGWSNPNEKTGPLSGTIAEHVINTGRGSLVKVESTDDVISRYPVTIIAIERGTRAFLTAPLVVGNRPIGTFQLRSPDVDSFSNDDVEIAQRVADQMAGAFANAQLCEEREKAHRELEKSEANYRDLVETAHELIWRSDPMGRLTFLNPAWEEISGYSVEETLGKPFSRFQLPAMVERDSRGFQQHISGNRVRGYETTFINKNGEEVTLLMEAELDFDADGNVVGLHGISRDVTAERKASHRQEKRLKELTCLYGVVDLLRNGSPIEKIAWDIANLIPPGWQYSEITAARVSFDQLSFQTDGYVRTEWILASDIVVDGQTRGSVEVCYTEPKPAADEGPFLTEERNLINRIADLLADTIEFRTAEERVRLQSAAVDASVDAIIATSESGEIVLANPAAAKMFGHATTADLVGTAFVDLMPEGQRAAQLERLERLNRGEEQRILGRTVELEGLKSDGQLFPLEVSLNKLDGSGNAAYVTVLRDITERRRAERESRLHSAALEAAAEMVMITDQDGVIEYVNNAFTLETGYTPTEVIGANPDILKSEGQDPAYYTQLWSTIKAGRVWQGELMNRRKNGTVYPEEMTVTPIRDADGEICDFVAIKRDISDRKRNEEDLVRLATTDTLTGLLNRYQFNVLLKQHIELLKRREGQGAVVLLDLDGFKYINDAYGHGAGDELLALIARDLRERLRASDPVARIGGDEFAVILHDASPEDAIAIADELIALVEDCSLEIDGQQVSITSSAGVASISDSEANAVDLMAFADIALYAAKDAGRGRTILYDNLDKGRDTVSSLQRARMMIGDALREDRIKIHWQPIFSTIDLQPYKYEILARLEDSDGTTRLPAEFIPQAEVLGLMGDIDQRVVELALRAGADQHRAGNPVRLAVNISAKSLTDEMVDYIVKTADETGYPLSYLTVEITETAVLAVSSETKAAITRLVDAGVSLSMDDFGSGATSFGNLEALPFRYMKLDGAYVRDLATNKRGRELVTGLTQLAHTLGLEVIAEYVQDDETIEFLRHIGVEFAQGFHLAEPEPVPESSR